MLLIFLVSLLGSDKAISAAAHQEKQTSPEKPSIHFNQASSVEPLFRFCVSGNAPLVGGPMSDKQGRLYFLSSDGYLHAFEADGRYRFSYTVKGSPRGNLTLRRGDGAILLGTASGFLYAISQRGGKIFERRALTSIWSGISPLSGRSIAFVGLDQRIYALYSNGQARYRVKIPGQIAGEMLVGPGELVWLPLTDGVVQLKSSYRLQKIPLNDSIDQLIAFQEGVLAKGQKNLFYLDRRGRIRDTKKGVQAMAVDGDSGAILFQEDGQLLHLEAKPNQAGFDLSLIHQFPPLKLSGDPVLAQLNGESVALLTTETGHLWMYRGGEARKLKLSHESIGTPVHAQADQYYIPSASGRVCALKLNELP